jgi:hypothetical protein
MGRPFIRYLAATDSSPIGMLALGYLSGLLRIAPVRIGSMTGGLSGRWEHYAQLLATPMTEDYVNVVCCAPERWCWEQRVAVPKRRPDGMLDPGGEVASARQELYTVGRHNVLIVGAHPVSGIQLTAALRYEEIVTGSQRDFMSWNAERALRSRSSPHVIPLPIVDHEALHSVVMP